MCQPQGTPSSAAGSPSNGPPEAVANVTGLDVFRQMASSVEVWQLNSAALTVVLTFLVVQFRALIRSILWPELKRGAQRIVRNSIRRWHEAREGNASSSNNSLGMKRGSNWAQQNGKEWKQFADKQVGSDMDAAQDEHDDIVQDSAAEIPYHAVTYPESDMLKRSQYFYEQMKVRRSVRCFSGREVSLKLVQNLIKTAGTAPSGANLQPWTFCVVESAKLKRAIREVVEEQEQLNYSRRMGAQWVVDVAHLNVNWNKPYLTEAPLLIVVMKHAFQLNEEGERRPTYYSGESTSIAVGMLLAAIQNAGLVTVVTTPLNAGSAIREILQRPANEKVSMLLPLGYPTEGVHVPDIRKKPIEEIMRIY